MSAPDPRVDILAERLSEKPWDKTAPGWQDVYRQEARELLTRLDEVDDNPVALALAGDVLDHIELVDAGGVRLWVVRDAERKMIDWLRDLEQLRGGAS